MKSNPQIARKAQILTFYEVEAVFLPIFPSRSLDNHRYEARLQLHHVVAVKTFLKASAPACRQVAWTQVDLNVHNKLDGAGKLGEKEVTESPFDVLDYPCAL